jgi:SAM-dependent methyltransferase
MAKTVTFTLLAVVLASAATVGFSPRAVADREPSWEVFNESEDRTPQPVIEAMLKLANVGENDVVYDLGCGDGDIVVIAAKQFGAKAFGVDINPKMIARAKSNAEANNVADKTTFIEGDLCKTDLRSATVITLFLWPTMNIRLRPRLLDLAAGTRIISHHHDMGAWRPDRMIYVNSNDKHWGVAPVLLWIVPAKIAGDWVLHVDGGELRLNLEQSYQRFRGSAVVGGRTQRIRNGSINGTKVTFQLTTGDGKTKLFRGMVTAEGDIDGGEWRAKRKTPCWSGSVGPRCIVH